MAKIFVYGVAGVGKSLISRHLKIHLNHPLVEADHIKENIAPLIRDGGDPYRYIGAKQAWRKFGPLSAETTIQGLEAVRHSAKTIMDNELNLYANLVMEAVFLDPAYSRTGRMYLVTIENEARHRRFFYKNRVRSNENEEGFSACRLIQTHLINEAAQYPVRIIDNHAGAERVAEIILQDLSTNT